MINIYSDISFMQTGTKFGYACCIVDHEWNDTKPKYLTGTSQVSTQNTQNAHIAELMASTIALRTIETGPVIVHSDVKNINEFVNGAYKHRIKHINTQAVVQALREQTNRLEDCTLKYAEKGHRSHYYGECHRLAYKTLRSEPKTIEKLPKLLTTAEINRIVSQRT